MKMKTNYKNNQSQKNITLSSAKILIELYRNDKHIDEDEKFIIKYKDGSRLSYPEQVDQIKFKNIVNIYYQGAFINGDFYYDFIGTQDQFEFTNQILKDSNCNLSIPANPLIVEDMEDYFRKFDSNEIIEETRPEPKKRGRKDKKHEIWEKINKEFDDYREKIDPIINKMIDNKEINGGCYYLYHCFETGSYHWYSREMNKLTGNYKDHKKYRNQWNNIKLSTWKMILNDLREDREKAEEFINNIKSGKIVHGKYGYTKEMIEQINGNY
jgi:hypothetical protein